MDICPECSLMLQQLQLAEQQQSEPEEMTVMNDAVRRILAVLARTQKHHDNNHHPLPVPVPVVPLPPPNPYDQGLMLVHHELVPLMFDNDINKGVMFHDLDHYEVVPPPPASNGDHAFQRYHPYQRHTYPPPLPQPQHYVHGSSILSVMDPPNPLSRSPLVVAPAPAPPVVAPTPTPAPAPVAAPPVLESRLFVKRKVDDGSGEVAAALVLAPASRFLVKREPLELNLDLKL